MKHLELHILQSVPVSCLNRDDLNSPKTAVFGGVQRARVSSQSWKRAIREMARENMPELFKGKRTRRLVFMLVGHLVSKGFEQAFAVAISERVAVNLEKLDAKVDEGDFKKTKTLMFLSEAEVESIAAAINDSKEIQEERVKLETGPEERDEETQKKLPENVDKIFKNNKCLEKAIKSVQLKDAADIALFGRMVASDPSLNIEASSMFSHALSIHKVDNEIDFFSAVDDLQSKEQQGAGFASTLEFNSATYYRFAALNLDMLADAEHLGISMNRVERQTVVRAFVEATIKAVPGARKNTMNGNTLPVFVMGVVREKGHPIQLINAYEKSVRSTNGYIVESVKLLETEYDKLYNTWGIEAVWKASIPEMTANDFLNGMVNHVL